MGPCGCSAPGTKMSRASFAGCCAVAHSCSAEGLMQCQLPRKMTAGPLAGQFSLRGLTERDASLEQFAEKGPKMCFYGHLKGLFIKGECKNPPLPSPQCSKQHITQRDSSLSSAFPLFPTPISGPAGRGEKAKQCSSCLVFIKSQCKTCLHGGSQPYIVTGCQT